MYKKLIIIGASGHGRVVADIAENMAVYNEICFLDDNAELKETMGYQVIGSSEEVYQYTNCADVFVAIGNAKIRRNILEELDMNNASIATLIHPKAVIGKDVMIGNGTVVMAGAVVNSNVKVGCGCIINTGATVDHDCVIEDYVHISVGAHLAGNIEVRENTWVGIGAVISNNLEICSNCIIGAGAVVVKNINEQGTYIGVPAFKIKK